MYHTRFDSAQSNILNILNLLMEIFSYDVGAYHMVYYKKVLPIFYGFDMDILNSLIHEQVLLVSGGEIVNYDHQGQ